MIVLLFSKWLSRLFDKTKWEFWWGKKESGENTRNFQLLFSIKFFWKNFIYSLENNLKILSSSKICLFNFLSRSVQLNAIKYFKILSPQLCITEKITSLWGYSKACDQLHVWGVSEESQFFPLCILYFMYFKRVL